MACGGSAITGEGSALQASAQSFWTTSVFDAAANCGPTAPAVTYAADPAGSLCGATALGAGPLPVSALCSVTANEDPIGFRDPTVRFAGTDEPLTPTQLSNIDATSGSAPGVLHQVPVSVESLAVVVHFPEGCYLPDPTAAGGNGDVSTGGPNDAPGASTGDIYGNGITPARVGTVTPASTYTLRVHIAAAALEAIWAGVPTTWGQVTGGKILGTPTSAFETVAGASATPITSCQVVPVRRIVPDGASGLAATFKSYLSLLPGAGSLWGSSPVTGDSDTWPLTSTVGQATVTSGFPNGANGLGQCYDPSDICVTASPGEAQVAFDVQNTDGSIGFLDLGTARLNHFDLGPTLPDYTYWIPLQTVNPVTRTLGTYYVEPTVVPTDHVSTSTTYSVPTGSNCTDADIRGVPTTPASDPTLGDWSAVTATGSLAQSAYPGAYPGTGATTVGDYPTCELSFDLAFDDDAPVFGSTAAQQPAARTVKDYLTAVTSSAGQSTPIGDDGLLPASLVKIAQAGVAAIGWNKNPPVSPPAGTPPGSTPTTSTTTTTTTTTTTSSANTSTTPGLPSNALSLSKKKVKRGKFSLTLLFPGPGTATVDLTLATKIIARKTMSVLAGETTFSVTPGKAAIKRLRKGKHTVGIVITYTPTGGLTNNVVATLKVLKANFLAAPTSKKGSK